MAKKPNNIMSAEGEDGGEFLGASYSFSFVETLAFIHAIEFMSEA